MLGGRLSLPKAVLKRNASCRAGKEAKKVLLNTHKIKPVARRVLRSALPLRTARPIWQDARKTSRRAQRLRGSLPSGCHGRPRPALPETRTRLTRLAFAVSRAADSPHAICDGSNRTQVPETSPAQSRTQSTDGTGRGGRVRGVADQLPRFLQNFAEGAEDPAADRRTAESRNSTNVFLCRVLCDSMYHPDGT